MKDVTFVIPAYNEEKSIGSLLDNITTTYPRSKLIVVDNNSTDSTSEIARSYNAKLLHEKKQGKGHAIRKGFENINSKYALMLDADNTYDPADAINLVKPLKGNKADVVTGFRLNGNREEGSISTLNLVGNHMLSLAASLLYTKISDVCTGYWAFKKEVIDYLIKEGIDSAGFELEAEMFIKISQNNFKITEIPIRYGKRSDAPKLNSLKDGGKILATIFAYKLNGFNIITQNKSSNGLTRNKSDKVSTPDKLKSNYWSK